MATLLEQLETARGEASRLTGELTTLRAQLAQIPGGADGIAAFLAAHQGAQESVTRLTGELETIRGQLTTAQGETAAARNELRTFQEGLDARIEARAAEIVSSAGLPPAAGDTKATGTGAPTTREQHWARHAEILKAQGSAEASKYYREHKRKMDSY